MTRRRLIVLSSITIALVLSAIGAWLLVVPPIVESRATAAIERRAALRGTIGRARVGLSGAVLRDLVLHPTDGSGVEIRIEEARARGSLFGLALDGSSAIEGLELSGVTVTIDLTDAGARRALAAVRAALRGRGAATSGSSSSRDISLTNVGVEVRDANGSLLRVAGAEVARGASGIHASFIRLEVGAAPGDAAIVEQGSADFARSGTSWVVKTAGVRRADVVWASRAEDLDDATDAPDQPIPEEPVSTASRLRALVRAIEGVDGSGPAAGASPTAAATARVGPGGRARAASERLRALMPWLAPDATITLASTTVRTRTSTGVSTMLRDLDVGVTGQGPGVFRSRGSGLSASGGRVAWNMTLRPTEARAEGTVSFERLPLAVVAPLLPAAVPWHDVEQARLDGSMTVRGAAGEALAIEGHVRLSNAALASRRIAPIPIRGLDVTIDGVGTWHPDERRLDIGRGTLTLGRASASLSGAIEWARDHYLFDLVATLPSTHCNDAIGAIPRDLLQDVAGFSFSGRVGGRLEVHIDSRRLPATQVDIDVADGCVFESVPALADLRRFDHPFLHRVEEPNGSVFEMTTGPGTGNWVPFREVSPFLVQAVLGHEDGGFFGHHGFAVWGIREALIRNLTAGRYVQGASTITMQLVKNLFLRREKTLARKVQEVLLTWWIERAVPKHRILELYLNIIEFGPGIYGVRNATEHYFGREPADISPGEAAFIATILPNPKAYHHNYDRGFLSAGTAASMRRFLGILYQRGRIDDAAYQFALLEVDRFAFHREGNPPPPPRIIPGATRAIPEDADDSIEPDESHLTDDSTESDGQDGAWEDG